MVDLREVTFMNRPPTRDRMRRAGLILLTTFTLAISALNTPPTTIAGNLRHGNPPVTATPHGCCPD